MLVDLQELIDLLKQRRAALTAQMNIAEKKKELSNLEKQIEKESVWSDQEKSKNIMQAISRLKKSIELFSVIDNDITHLVELYEMALSEHSEDFEQDIKEEYERINKNLSELEIEATFTDKHDLNNAILVIHPGAGGTESCDWASMLLRMYQRYIESKGFSGALTDMLPGDEAGIKSATLVVSGDYAYGYLKGEAGIHRLVRISPFDSNKRRHTSFASVDVIPEIEDTIEVNIVPSDLRIDTYHSSGAGGQHVNVTDSAVRITHLPTGIVVQCQNERSQHQNKDQAMKILASRLYDHFKKEQEEKEDKQEKKQIAWGSQIRSYVLHPYKMVKDLRTGVEVGNAERVLDGDIDVFVDAYLKNYRTKQDS